MGHDPVPGFLIGQQVSPRLTCATAGQREVFTISLLTGSSQHHRAPEKNNWHLYSIPKTGASLIFNTFLFYYIKVALLRFLSLSERFLSVFVIPVTRVGLEGKSPQWAHRQ